MKQPAQFRARVQHPRSALVDIEMRHRQYAIPINVTFLFHQDSVEQGVIMNPLFSFSAHLAYYCTILTVPNLLPKHGKVKLPR